MVASGAYIPVMVMDDHTQSFMVLGKAKATKLAS